MIIIRVIRCTSPEAYEANTLRTLAYRLGQIGAAQSSLLAESSQLSINI